MATREPSPERGKTPGYPEKQPRDKDDARRPHPRKPRNPDEGGLDRDPEQDGKHEGD